ncbi:MAG: hypothetical protein CW742_13470 [Methanoregula sp.]|nr:MAG: hypothetical protein CW742_13470 [Methanoregula sp.]
MHGSNHPGREGKVLKWRRKHPGGTRFSSTAPAKEVNLEPYSVGIVLGRFEDEKKGVRKAGRSGDGGTIWEVVPA